MAYVWENALWVREGIKPTIIIFARDTVTKEPKKFAVRGFKPYFYISDPEGKYINCYGKPISKVVCDRPDEVSKKRKQYENQGIETFEADILFEMRYFIDKKITYGFDENLKPVEVPILPPRVVFYDIEVDIPEDEGIDETKNKFPIVAISVRDSYTGKVLVFTANEKKVHHLQVCCGSEQGVIESFCSYIHSINPDILTGWYNLDFDMPYIFGRAAVCKCSLNGLSRVDSMPVDDPLRIPGRSHIDMLEFFKDWSKPMGQFATYDLKFISKNFAGFEYKDHGEHIHSLIASDDWETLVQYSANDVIALGKIDEKAGLIQYHENLRRLIGIHFSSTIKRTHLVETLLMRHGIKPIPTRKKREKVDFEGALVIQPSVGIKDNVIFLDAKSLYPSIILAFNLSPDIDKMIPKTITYVLNEREKYRALKMAGKASETDEVTEQSLKYIANSFYGVMGSPYFKVYEPEIAATITRKGREINLLIQSVVKELGYDIIYGDTDSVAISPVLTVEDGKELETIVNKRLLHWAREHNVRDEFAPVVKFEKFFSKMFFKKKVGSEQAAKKKYVGHLVWKDGKTKDQIDYTGVEIKRSDTAPITKRVMEQFFKKVLIDGDSKGAVKDVVDAIKLVQSGNVNVHDVAIPKGMHSMNTSGAWYKGVQYGTDLFQIKFNSSKKPKLLYCKSPYESVCIDDDITNETVVARVTVDWNKMADRVIMQKMRSLVESIGYSWENIEGRQVTMNELFSQYGGK